MTPAERRAKLLETPAIAAAIKANTESAPPVTADQARLLRNAFAPAETRAAS